MKADYAEILQLSCRSTHRLCAVYRRIGQQLPDFQQETDSAIQNANRTYHTVRSSYLYIHTWDSEKNGVLFLCLILQTSFQDKQGRRMFHPEQPY